MIGSEELDKGIEKDRLAHGKKPLKKKDDNDGYTYTRLIGGHKHKKRAYGTLKI